MRTVSRRFNALLGTVVRWVTKVDWSNDGGQTWTAATYVGDGTVTASSTSQIRWTCSLALTGVSVGLSGINPFSTQIRIAHGIDGEPLLWMGRYKVTRATASSDSQAQVQVEGASFETYLIGAQFTATQVFQKQSGMKLAMKLIRDVLPSAQIAWAVDDVQVPRIVEQQDRWGLIDGDRDSNSVARALGARIYTTPEGNWVANPVPSLQASPVWSATAGPNGNLMASAEELSDEGVCNIQVVNGQSTSADTPPFRAGIAQDLDKTSPTYVLRPVEQGGFGPRPAFYTSQLITSSSQAQKAAQAMLAPKLGLRQKVTFTQLHNPALEPGDVGLVATPNGNRRAILDSITYSLDGQPLQAETRTTTFNLMGSVGDVPSDG